MCIIGTSDIKYLTFACAFLFLASFPCIWLHTPPHLLLKVQTAHCSVQPVSQYVCDSHTNAPGVVCFRNFRFKTFRRLTLSLLKPSYDGHSSGHYQKFATL